MVSAIRSSFAPPIDNIPASDDKFKKDLIFIHQTIFENHPGAKDSLNPDFANQLKDSYNTAEHRLREASSAEDKARIVAQFAKSFKDSHLWVRYDFAQAAPPISEKEQSSYAIQTLKEGVTWVSVPTFSPSKNQIADFQKLLRQLPSLRNQTIILDLRGNGGGDSNMGCDFLKALFGPDYVERRLAEAEEGHYVEWRVSTGNLEHFKDLLIPLVNARYKEDHPIVQSCRSVYEGLKHSYTERYDFYKQADLYQPPSHPQATSLFEGKIIALIDGGCGSACLNFIDDLKTMKCGALFVGKPTHADTCYMELRTVRLPNDDGALGFPIKVHRNRPRGNNVPHFPDIPYQGNLGNTAEVQNWINLFIQ